jgi:ribosomal protein S18 acetylase RimI-like enzyme
VIGIKVEQETTFDPNEVRALYESVGWNAYTADMDALGRSLANSDAVLVARDESGRMLGLARTISDRETICYLQDLLVAPDAQRRGIGRTLLQEVMRRYENCRFLVLSTEDDSTVEGAKVHDFYRRAGLVPHAEQGMTAFARRIH